ncbi:Inactive rhomboid protein 1 [Pseudolycoriella hygida]|uniref:Inactive rhomboid protein 1 n=1 Tax=Pseudolycoriella hygida TaxID=35572 RepID=A0A9Q0N7T6_9DIPT|nr:Inactive rhomboid protein 1 [Pseudolycoriella hygida]
MSSDDGIEYHPNISHQIPAQQQQQHPLSLSNTSTAPTSAAVSLTAGTQTSNISSNHNSKGSSTNNRRKSSITYSQLHNQNFGIIKDNNNDLLSSTSTNATIDHAKSMHSLASVCSNTSAYGTMQSPSRFSQSGELHLGNRLSIHSDRYDENIACCLPPPSPAPNNDRYVMGIPSPSLSSHHYQEHKFAVHHRSMSPSSRYRSSLPERYRDVSPKCERFIPPPHYLANSTPLASSDSYAYLSANVHTPVKRYVPTPPTPTEIYSEPSSTSSNYHGNSHLPQQQSQQSQSQAQQQSMTRNAQNSTLPYRYRMKCCASDQSNNLQSQHQQTSNAADHYATPPRARPSKCTQQPSGLVHSSSSGCSSSVGTSGNNGNTCNSGRQSSSSTSSSSRNNCSNDYIQRTPSMEYIGPSSSARVVTPVNNSNNEAPCSHCSTGRRTTGVHQTTQTTGPISPVPSQPLSISSTSNNLSSSSSSSSTSSTASAQCSDASEQLTAHSSSPSPPASSSALSLQQQQQQNQQLSPNTHASLDDAVITKQIKPTLSQLQPVHSNASAVPRSILQPQPPQSQSPPSINQQSQNLHLSNNNLMIGSTLTLQRSSGMPLRQMQQHQQRMSRKHRVKEYLRREIAKFFGVDCCSEEVERTIWADRQKRLAVRRFGQLKPDADLIGQMGHQQRREQHGDRPDILPAQTNDETDIRRMESDHRNRLLIERKATVPTMIWNGMSYIVQLLGKNHPRPQRQWSRSFAPCHITQNDDTPGDMFDGLSPLQDDEVFFGSPNGMGNTILGGNRQQQQNHQMVEQSRQLYMNMGERVHGWRTSATEPQISNQLNGHRGTRISSQILDGVLENSRRPLAREVKLLRPNELDDRYDHRPFFTYWINLVQILVLMISLVCYGIGPIGIGMEHKSGQVLVTSLSLQQVQHQEPRNVWIGPRGDDLVHLGANFAACMRKDTKILEVISKTRRQERETACCIRNDDSGCVQSSQADCSVRGLWPTKSISTWKKWSPGESGPGGRISGSVCGLDPKFCDAPASVAPYEWPDDITKWPICRKTNSFSQRFRFKDNTAEHMVCEVIGHPCCVGVYGECRITTKEFCDFVNGYFHEEASLCSQVSCLNDVCGMFPFISTDVPDQFYRLFTSLCLHAGILHLAITIAFQHIYLADLERLIGPIRTAIVYIGSGIAGNLTSAIFVPYKPEVSHF